MKTEQHQLDVIHGDNVEKLVKPFKLRYAERTLSETEDSREPVKTAKLLAETCCIHGVLYDFRGTTLGCRKCGFRGRRSYMP